MDAGAVVQIVNEGQRKYVCRLGSFNIFEVRPCKFEMPTQLNHFPVTNTDVYMSKEHSGIAEGYGTLSYSDHYLEPLDLNDDVSISHDSAWDTVATVRT
jgi:hypothetical protein